ncbi:MAG TPA: hypothetical protein VM364_19195 [Vicinamibacterales bacterium]|nr:hypothetical protein [Vicinamibacterales bacterium]
MRHRLAPVVLAATATCACSAGTLDRERAASLIAATDGFNREAHFTIRTDAPMQSAFECLAQAEVERVPLHRFAAERGWVRYETREATLGFGKKAFCPAMALTTTGQAASAAWTRGRVASASEGVAWSIPIGRREVLGEPRVTTLPDESAQLEFDWKWTPNDVGMALRNSVDRAALFFDQRRTGRASCRRFDEDWRCQLALWTAAEDAGEFQP